MANQVIQGKLLYSTCTNLAYDINVKYYHDIHYVWCTDSFDRFLQPASSTPMMLCIRYMEAIIGKDGHASAITDNIKGIKKGIKAKLDSHVITPATKKLICDKIKYAELDSFYPVIYLIDRAAIPSNRLIQVPDEKKASPDSVEYWIKDLRREEFEIINFKDIMIGKCNLAKIGADKK